MSFYSLPSLIMKHAKHKDLGTAYLFYYATDAALSPSGSQGGEAKAKERLSKRLNSLVNDCLIVAKDVSVVGRAKPVVRPSWLIGTCTSSARPDLTCSTP